MYSINIYYNTYKIYKHSIPDESTSGSPPRFSEDGDDNEGLSGEVGNIVLNADNGAACRDIAVGVVVGAILSSVVMKSEVFMRVRGDKEDEGCILGLALVSILLILSPFEVVTLLVSYSREACMSLDTFR